MSQFDRSGATTQSPPPDGWMFLHGSAGREISDENMAALLHRLGLQPGSDNRLHMAGIDLDWAQGGQARSLAAPFVPGNNRLLGIAAPPDIDTGCLVGFRVADGAGPLSGAALQRLCAVVALVGVAVDAESIGWLPATLWSSAAMFADAIVATERQGLPPVMHLVAFETVDNVLHTHGLSWFCGHELRLTAPLAYPESQALRRMARLAVDAIMHRRAMGAMTVAGIDKGEVLVIGNIVDGVSPPYVPVELRPASS